MAELPPMLRRVAGAGIDPVKLRDKTVAVFGVGGLGALVAEMMVRVGIGGIILIDRDVVGPENFNRLGFDPDDVGKPKVEALAEKLRKIAEVRGKEFPLRIETHHADVIGWEGVREVVKKSDLVFTCFDNLEARLEVNYWAVKEKVPLVDGGTSEDGLSGRVVVVRPGKTPCLYCLFGGGTVILEPADVDAPCNVSLPTVMSIIASLQVDQGLRILLGRGGVVERIDVNLREKPFMSTLTGLKRRRNCPVCGDL